MSPDVHALAGAYVLGSLPVDEVETFREHLSDCAACRQEVEELQETATQLGLAAAQPPPERLRSEVLTAVRQTRQVPPLLPATGDRHRHRRWPRVLAAAAAVVLIAAAGVSVVVWNAEESPQSEVVAVLGAPDADISTAQLSGGGTLTVVSSPERGKAVVLADDLPPLPDDRIYQLWLIGASGEPRPTEVLLEGGGPNSGSHLISSVSAEDQIAVTREPAGGSEQPTTTPLAVVKPG